MNKLLLSCITSLVFALVSCSQEPSVKQLNMGMIYWPYENCNDQCIKEGVKLTIENSNILTAQIPWELNRKSFVDDVKWISHIARETQRQLIINVDWLNDTRSGLRGSEWSFLNINVREKFIENILTVVRKHKPAYINLAVEVNYFALIDSSEFKAFVEIYNELVPKIKDCSKNTKIGVTFQLQLLVGSHTKWHSDNTLGIINVFGDNLDYIGISSYPHLSSNSKDFITELQKVELQTSKNISIFETSFPKLKKDSKSNQSSYLANLLDYLSSNERYDLLIWTSTADICYESDNWKYKLGLYNCDLTPRKATFIWNDYFKKKSN